jgi:choline dehydrogenase-like flavoprotein
MDPVAHRARRVEPVRGLRFHPFPRGIAYPDIQFHFLPIAVRYDGSTVAEGHGFQAHVGPMRSASRGRVALKGPDPGDAALDPVQLHEPRDQDWVDFRKAIRLTREIMAQPPMQPFAGDEILPGVDANATTPSTPRSGSMPKAPITPAAPAGWGARTIRARWWTRRRG